MVSKEQKKLNRVISFLKKGLSGLADELESTVKGINEFLDSLQKAQKDLKGVTAEAEVQTVSTSSTKIAAPSPEIAKTAAASTLFSLLSGTGGEGAPAAAPTVAATGGGPPKAPGGGPPKAPGGGPPKAPGGALPPAPKLPPAPGTSGPPAALDGVKPPTFAKRAGAPAAPGSPPGGAAPGAAPQPGGGLGSLRDEMLDELNRLKKIMRGE